MTELTDLHAALQAQRRHVLGQVADLTDDDWRRPVLPSGWTALGLVHHLAVDDERFWISAVFGGDADAWASLPPGESFWSPMPEGLTPAEAVSLYEREIAASDAVILAATADDAPRALPDWMPLRLESLRQILLHLTGETAVHAGHLDAQRELLDGRQWLSD